MFIMRLYFYCLNKAPVTTRFCVIKDAFKKNHYKLQTLTKRRLPAHRTLSEKACVRGIKYRQILKADLHDTICRPDF